MGPTAAAPVARVSGAAARVGWSATTLATLFAVAVAALAGTVGADDRWAAAVGRSIVGGADPDSVPFAAAPSHAWANVPVLSELFSWIVYHALGLRGLCLAQTAAVALAFVALGYAMRRAGARDAGRGVAIGLVAFGAFGALAVARLQLFSLVFFAVMLAIVHADGVSRSRLIWALPPLVALWANLHGGVLVGVAVAAVYLLTGRGRSRLRESVSVLAACGAALFVTPAFLRTPEYFLGVMQSEAARRGAGMWAPLSASPVGIVLCIAAAALAVLAWRGRPARWELIAIAALAAATVHSARTGVWLLMVLAVPAARAFEREQRLRPPAAAAVATLFASLIVVGLVRGPLASGATAPLIAAALQQAHGEPILAQDVLAEQVALAGGRVVVGNPLDAFSRPTQSAYLDWAAGSVGGDVLLCNARTVLVHPDTAAAARIAEVGRFRRVRADARSILYVAAAAPGRCTG